jgi:hypothetical protein
MRMKAEIQVRVTAEIQMRMKAEIQVRVRTEIQMIVRRGCAELEWSLFVFSAFVTGF